MSAPFAFFCIFLFSTAVFAGDDARSSRAPSGYILQSNDYDPTTITSQPSSRWYHWLGADPAVTHLETGLAVDSADFAGRGQRIDVMERGPVTALQVKIKRIGQPGALHWEAGSLPGASDLGRGGLPADQVSSNYEHFVTLPLNGGQPRHIYLRLWAAHGRCPDDYYAVYCTWREIPAARTTIHAYDGTRQIQMIYRAIRPDRHGAALEADGREVAEGASMMTRLLSPQAAPSRRQLLPGEEEPYAFVDRLAAGIDPRRQGLPWPNARPEPREVAIGRDWRIEVAAPRSVRAVTAVEDLRRFMADSMKLPLKVVWDVRTESESEGGAKTAWTDPKPNSILLAQGGEGTLRPASYRFIATSNGILLQGVDARGILRAAWYLEDLLMLRGGPWVMPDDRLREPRYSPRATCSAWAGTGELATPAPVYTDAHLSLISHYGYDAIWLTWYGGDDARTWLPTRIAPGRTPEGTTYRPFTSRLRDLTERAEKYDLQVVILYVAPHPSGESERQAMARDARTFLAEVPKIEHVILLDEGMGSTREGPAAWVDTCNLLTKAFLDARPGFDVAAWPYTLQSKSPDPAKWDITLRQFARLDPHIDFLSNFDTRWGRRRDGRLQYAYDYEISLRAPTLDFSHAVDFIEADSGRKGRPPRRVWAKIETRVSQESNVQPEIPCMQRWAERFDQVNGFDSPPLSALVANWYHSGFFPTPVTELFGWMSYTDAPPADQILRALARRDYGPGQEELVLAAWRDFSDAIWNYPFYYGLSYTMNSGLAQPFWLDPRAANPRPWRRGFVNSLEQMDMLGTSDEGRENRGRMAKLDELWTAGLAQLARAVAAAPPEVRLRAEKNWRNAKSFGYAADATLRLVRWLDARGRLMEARSPAGKRAACDELEAVGREELAAAREALPMYLRDSSLGFLNHGRGVFTAQTIADKIIQLEKTLEVDLPALRAGIGVQKG